MDRRVERTKANLQNALLDLLREKDMNDIQIQELTDRADTAKVTFYRHYGTKEELLLDAIESIYQMLTEVQRPTVTYARMFDFNETPPNYVLFEFLAQDKALHQRLFTGSLCAVIQQRIRHYIVEEVVLTLGKDARFADLPVGLIANHFATVTIGNIQWWLTEDVPYTVAEIARLTHWTAMAGMMHILGRSQQIIMPEQRFPFSS